MAVQGMSVSFAARTCASTPLCATAECIYTEAECLMPASCACPREGRLRTWEPLVALKILRVPVWPRQ